MTVISQYIHKTVSLIGQLPEKLLGVVNRNGEGDAWTDLHTVDTNSFTIKIDERSTRVTKCDGGVCLNILSNILSS